MDKGSTHGTFVNQNKIPSNQYVNIKNGDAIVFGKDMEVYKFVNLAKPLPSSNSKQNYGGYNDRSIHTRTTFKDNLSKTDKEFSKYHSVSKDKIEFSEKGITFYNNSEKKLKPSLRESGNLSKSNFNNSGLHVGISNRSRSNLKTTNNNDRRYHIFL